MTPRAPIAPVSHTTNGEMRPNGDPPQPTLAAQFVQQFTDGRKRPKTQDKETFRQLLREVLGAGGAQSAHDEASDTNVDFDCRLIYVIVKAGLESTRQDNPFDKPTDLSQQMIDSLGAVEITIKRSPGVLFATSPKQETDPNYRGHMYYWLLPKLFSFLGKSTNSEVVSQVINLIRSCVLEERRTQLTPVQTRSVLTYIKGCARDSIHYLETFAFDKTEHPSLPSIGTFTGLQDNATGQKTPENVPRITIESREQAQNVAVRLLSIVIDIECNGYGRPSSIRKATPMRAWILGAITQLWQALGPDGGASNYEATLSPCLELWLHSVRSFFVIISQVIVSFLIVQPLPLTALLEDLVCRSLLDLAYAGRASNDLYHVIDECLSPALMQLRDDTPRLQSLSQDLQRAVSLIVHLQNQDPALGPTCLSASQVPPFENSELLEACRKYFCISTLGRQVDDLVRPMKRARLSKGTETTGELGKQSGLLAQTFKLLSTESEMELEGLNKIAIDRYPELSDNEQCLLFSNLRQMACQSIITRPDGPNSTAASVEPTRCLVCDADSKDEACITLEPTAKLGELLRTMSDLIKLPRNQKSRQPRIAAMMALSRMLSHTIDDQYLSLATSTFGQWCLQALQSSVRELRIAAGRALPVFLRDSLELSLYSKNRLVALDFLRNLSERGDLALQETCILAWAQIARNTNDGDEMNLVLIKLVEYLGHTNALISGLAFDELQRICSHSPFSAMKLFAPYWRTIAVTVVQDLHKRPQIAQQMSDLLAMSVPDFLVLTQVHTIPFFILTKRQDVLQRIADACGRSIMALCREHNNLAAILASILLCSSRDAENLVMTLLNAVSPEFEYVDCAELLKSEPQSTATELLKSAGENDETRRSKAHQALHFLASVTHGRQGSSRGATRKMDVVGAFFENHILGIMAILADTINDGKGPQPNLEKIRCLGAIREMIKIAKGHVSNGLPQICACLRSAIGNKELTNEAFEAWIVMMDTLGEDDIATLVDTTFAVLVQNWDSFLPTIRSRAHDMVSRLLKAHGGMIGDIIHTLPSLASIPLMSKFEGEMEALKAQMDVKHHFQAFGHRCRNENATVVTSALTELVDYLENNQNWLHETATSEQPDPVVGQLTRSILDTSVLFNESSSEISILCARCLGLIGCLDPTRIEAVKEKKQILVLSNFARDEEVRDFILFFLREVLVKAFVSATNSRSQGFLAYAIQELLSLGDFQSSVGPRSRDIPFDANSQRWHSLPESVRTLLTPFLDSKYFVTAGVAQPPCKYPLFRTEMSHRQWLRAFTFDLLKREIGTGMVQQLFSVLSRIIRSQDIVISEFLLPFAVSNIVLSGTDLEKLDIVGEMLAVLDQPLTDNTPLKDNVILCSQTIFHVLDYLSRWMQEKKKELSQLRSPSSRSRPPPEAEIERYMMQISSIELVLNMIPADVISRRAVECNSFSRALFHWEQYIRQEVQKHADIDRPFNQEPLFERLQEIYTQIDEPDGIEGISAHLQVLNIDQQILEHRKAGRWTAAQSWYEMLLTERPNDLDVQFNLLTSLKESGQHDVLLNQIQGLEPSEASKALSLPFAAEAAWVTGKWDRLKTCVEQFEEVGGNDFNIGIGRALVALSNFQSHTFSAFLDELRKNTARSLSSTNASSLQSCHNLMLRFHVIAELDAISGLQFSRNPDKNRLMTTLTQRLDVLGPFLADKQYILGLRRAAMLLCKGEFTKIDIASAWLASAKLARKGESTHQAFDAVLHASRLEDDSATIEHSRLLWREGSHRKAIQSLEGAIAVDAFKSHDHIMSDESITNMATGHTTSSKNILKAKAHLLLAKWIDGAGQTQSDAIIHEYKNVIEAHNRWEKGHYYLGKHYNKLLESEKAKPPSKQAQTFITGETAKLVVENYLRSLAFGAKYVYQTLPRILTLWLGLGYETEQPLDPKYGNDENFRSHTMSQRRKLLSACNSQVKKYTDRLPAWVMYTALAQIVARICHPNQAVYNVLVDIVAKVVIQHTPQALWTLLAMIKSSSKDRANRGAACLTRILGNAKKDKYSVAPEMKNWIQQGQKLSDQLLHVCEGAIQGKPNHISLSKDLGFDHKTAICKLAVPLESSLTATLPIGSDGVNMRQHKAFSNNDYVHISSFLDDVSVLNSLQRPRKISIRGSDGRVYAMLCKPKDDLRKDQRLMEFNAMINRSLKKDAESSKRRLYIKTYAVTPLNEECGLIEWVDNLKTLREILLASYKQKSIQINFAEIRQLLTESVSAPNMLPIFTDKVLPHFPPVFHEWFVEMFPEPGAWFAARLRYTRSCAVMSIVGHVLGLGDRHGENILFEEGNGGTLHVDFNCLFDKGLTFEKPELVPFRLTHNMVDAFGAQGYEGPFRKSCELTLGILRGNQDTLMTILETFLYDPTTDFIGKKKKLNVIVPDTPEGVLESVRNKVHGLLAGESVPLSVEGYTDELIKQARDPWKLASMYIGWCAFF